MGLRDQTRSLGLLIDALLSAFANFFAKEASKNSSVATGCIWMAFAVVVGGLAIFWVIQLT